MGKKIPVIGVTPWYDYDNRNTFIKHGYIEGINRAGGFAVLLPLCTDESLMHVSFETCDGILLSGGPDVDASYFNEPNMPFTGSISPLRDCMEVFIAKKAVELKKPILGICRGAQVMNVSLGGTLYQDIAVQLKEVSPFKHSQQAPRWYPTHDIHVSRESKVWTAFKKEIMKVNSFHHQAVKDVAPDFIVTSRAADGVVESIEHISHPFAVGVQWHPECMWENNDEHLKLFEAFVEAAKKWSASNSF